MWMWQSVMIMLSEVPNEVRDPYPAKLWTSDPKHLAISL